MLGAPIFEAEIASVLNISRSPVREAIKRLEAEGLVTSFTGRGSFVTQITKQDLEEIFEMRMLFELNALRKSAQNISKEFWEELEKSVLALDKSSSREAFYKADQQLHHTIISCSGNSRIESFYLRLETQIAIVRRISAKDPGHFKNSKAYHLKIIRAMKENDLEAAEKHLQDHITDVRVNTIKVYLYGMGIVS